MDWPWGRRRRRPAGAFFEAVPARGQETQLCPLAAGPEVKLLRLLPELVDDGAAYLVHEELADALDALLQVFYPEVQRVELADLVL